MVTRRYGLAVSYSSLDCVRQLMGQPGLELEARDEDGKSLEDMARWPGAGGIQRPGRLSGRSWPGGSRRKCKNPKIQTVLFKM